MKTFSSRADAIFGQLGPIEQSAWSLKENPEDFKPGRSIDDSSDDEASPPPQPIMPQYLIDSDEEELDQERPSCKADIRRQKAFEEEEDEDDFDRVAACGLHRSDDLDRPTISTTVLPDNPFDRLCKLRGREVEGDDGGEEDIFEPQAAVAVEASKPEVCKRIAADASCSAAEKQQRRRISWADEVGDRRTASSEEPATATSQKAPDGNSAQGRGGQMTRRGGSRALRPDCELRGFVPDHVRHPERYTVYTFSEPVTVGSGARGRHEEEDMREAAAAVIRDARSEEAVSFHDPERPTTTFGSGIEFRPRGTKNGRREGLEANPNPQQQQLWLSKLKASIWDEDDDMGNESTQQEQSQQNKASELLGSMDHDGLEPSMGAEHVATASMSQSQRTHARVFRTKKAASMED